MIVEITATEWTLSRWSERYEQIRNFVERYRGLGSKEEGQDDSIKWTVNIENDESDREALQILRNIVGIHVW